MKKRFLAIILTAIFLTQGVVPAMGELEEIPAPEEFNIEYEEQDEAFFEDSAPEEENLIFEEPAEELLGAEEETLILEEEDTVLTDDGWAPSDEDLLAEDDFVPEEYAPGNAPVPENQEFKLNGTTEVTLDTFDSSSYVDVLLTTAAQVLEKDLETADLGLTIADFGFTGM